MEGEDRRVQERRVDREPRDRDEPEEAVEDEEEDRHEEKAAESRLPRLGSESLPSVAEMSVRSSVSNLTGSAPVWRTIARSLASIESRPVICAPFRR